MYFTIVRKNSPLSFCAKPKGEVAESNTKEDIPFLMEEGGPSQTVGEGVKTQHSKTPHPPCRAPVHFVRRINTLKNRWILQLRAKALRAE
tara:strand:+ start:293 stop:562 length:270 start_codon:yes stop_codon:yes gene_type:complete